MTGLVCSSDGCGQPAVVALQFRGQPGHVHDCTAHEAAVREWCDVVASAPVVDGVCPVSGCTVVPIYRADPTRLDGGGL